MNYQSSIETPDYSAGFSNVTEFDEHIRVHGKQCATAAT